MQHRFSLWGSRRSHGSDAEYLERGDLGEVDDGCMLPSGVVEGFASHGLDERHIR